MRSFIAQTLRNIAKRIDKRETRYEFAAKLRDEARKQGLGRVTFSKVGDKE